MTYTNHRLRRDCYFTSSGLFTRGDAELTAINMVELGQADVFGVVDSFVY